ncbi:MAG: integration host factor subunit beta [Planctomycetota bacterium]|jgi:integration host factor subunit beta
MDNQDPRTITKKELVNRISEDTGQTKVVVKEILQLLLDEVIDELARGNRIEFREFGVFEVRERAARKAQNPRTLEKVTVPAKRVVKFKVGRTMRERVCSDPAPEREQAEARPASPSSPQAAATPPPPAPPQPPPGSPNSPF